jgi:hypothetical protein
VAEVLAVPADKWTVIEAQYTWRPLGAILVDRGVLSEDQLKGALREQRRSGRLLGEVLVEAGIVSAFSLARALSEQHGVKLEPVDEGPAGVETAAAGSKPTSWRPLGKVLVENGFLTKIQLEQALAEQLRSGGRRLLGEILVASGALSAYSLARALGEQNGVALGAHDDLEAVLTSSAEGQPMYEVREVGGEDDDQPRDVLYRSASFLEAIDFAAEFIEDHEPDGLEIHRTEAEARESVWTYSESLAAETAASRKTISDTFGFDPMQWHDARPQPPKDAIRWVPPRRSA